MAEPDSKKTLLDSSEPRVAPKRENDNEENSSSPESSATEKEKAEPKALKPKRESRKKQKVVPVPALPPREPGMTSITDVSPEIVELITKVLSVPQTLIDSHQTAVAVTPPKAEFPVEVIPQNSAKNGRKREHAGELRKYAHGHESATPEPKNITAQDRCKSPRFIGEGLSPSPDTLDLFCDFCKTKVSRRLSTLSGHVNSATHLRKKKEALMMGAEMENPHVSEVKESIDYSTALAAAVHALPSFDYCYRVVVVTGGGSGIGQATLLEMARQWGRECYLIAVGRTFDKLKETVEKVAKAALFGAVCECYVADLTVESDVKELFEWVSSKFGRIDVLFNNAGRSLPATPIEDLSMSDFENVMRTNLTSTFLCTKYAIQLMKRQQPQGGRIINNGSIAAHTPRPESLAYTCSKHAILGLTKSTALDGRKHNIACSQVDIGNAASDMTKVMTEGVMQADGSVKPEPLCDVADVAKAVTFMASLPLSTNVLNMTVMATAMPYVGRG